MTRVGVALLLGFGCCLVAGCGGSSSGAPTTTLAPTTTFASGTTRIFVNHSASMEPTLDCKKGPDHPGCLGNGNDRLVVKVGGRLKQGEIVVFTRPREAEPSCAAGGRRPNTFFVKRVIGTPGETVHEDDKGFIYINGKRLSEPYLSAAARLADSHWFGQTWHIPKGAKGGYLIMSDNRAGPCDPRGDWCCSAGYAAGGLGYLPQRIIIGPVVRIIRTH